MMIILIFILILILILIVTKEGGELPEASGETTALLLEKARALFVAINSCYIYIYIYVYIYIYSSLHNWFIWGQATLVPK